MFAAEEVLTVRRRLKVARIDDIDGELAAAVFARLDAGVEGA
jgi:hypothetical protein